MQERLDHAKTSAERDGIYADYAVALTDKGNPLGRELVDKIGDTELRKNVKAYTDSQWAQLLDEALAESRRISGNDPDRARSLTAVAVGLADIDQVRAWETLAEVVKAANSAEGFTGEDSRISSRLQTSQMVVMTNATAEEFDLLPAFRLLARADLLRAIQLATASRLKHLGPWLLWQ